MRMSGGSWMSASAVVLPAGQGGVAAGEGAAVAGLGQDRDGAVGRLGDGFDAGDEPAGFEAGWAGDEVVDRVGAAFVDGAGVGQRAGEWAVGLSGDAVSEIDDVAGVDSGQGSGSGGAVGGPGLRA